MASSFIQPFFFERQFQFGGILDLVQTNPPSTRPRFGPRSGPNNRPTNSPLIKPILYLVFEDCRQKVSANQEMSGYVLTKGAKENRVCSFQQQSELLQVRPDEILIESTGVIGQRIKKEHLLSSLPKLISLLSSSIKGADSAAVAITTTEYYYFFHKLFQVQWVPMDLCHPTLPAQDTAQIEGHQLQFLGHGNLQGSRKSEACSCCHGYKRPDKWKIRDTDNCSNSPSGKA